MSTTDSSENSGRRRKPNQLLQDERCTVYVNGYAVEVRTEPPLPVAQSKKKQKSVPAPVVVPAEPVLATPPAVVDLPQPDGTEAPAPVPGKRVQIVWSDSVISLLLDKIVAINATEYKKMDERFEQIATELFKLESFKTFTKVKGDSIRSYFTKLKKECKAKWAMESEGANLSGLEEFDSDSLKPWEKKMYTLIVKELKGEKGKAVTGAKSIQREISMLQHERAILLKGVKGVKGVIDLVDEGDEEEGNGDGDDEGDEDYEEGCEKDKEGAKKKKKTQKELANELRKLDTPSTKKSSKTPSTKTSLTVDDDEVIEVVGPLEKRLTAFMDATDNEMAAEKEERDDRAERRRWELQRDKEQHEAKMKEKEMAIKRDEAAIIAAEATRKHQETLDKKDLAITNLLTAMYSKYEKKE